MLTVLTIDDRVRDTGWGRVFSSLSVDTIKSQVTEGTVPVRHINYINRTGRINWKRLERLTGRGEPVLYSGEAEPDRNTGIRFFRGTELAKRLCGNMALAVLDAMEAVPKNLRIGLYDPAGEHSDLAELLLKATDNLIVITKNYGLYREQAERLLSETGAVLCVNSGIKLLSDCMLIIAPDGIDTAFSPKSNAVVLSGEKPLVSLGCTCCYRYCVTLTRDLAQQKPEGITTELFAAGLYSLCKFYQLGSLVPLVCSSDSESHTILSLRRYLYLCFST